jgi:hypothetical protein
LVGEADRSNDFGAIRGVATNEKGAVASCPPVTREVIEELEKVKRAPAGAGEVAYRHRPAHAVHVRIAEVLFHPVDPILRHDAVLIGQEDQPSAGCLDAEVARGAGRQPPVGTDQCDGREAVPHDLRRRVHGAVDDDDLSRPAAGSVCDRLQAVDDRALAVIRRYHD